MNKVSFLVRWGVVFGILSFFTLYSVTALGNSSTKAYADAISSNVSFRGDDNFVVINENQSKDDDQDGVNHPMQHVRMICAISQDQLNALRAAFTTTVFTSTEVGGQQKGILEVDKTPGVTKHAIRQVAGLDTSGPKCQILKTPQSFLLFLLPGVS